MKFIIIPHKIQIIPVNQIQFLFEKYIIIIPVINKYNPEMFYHYQMKY